MDVDTRSTAYRVILFFTVGGRLACIGGEGIIIIGILLGGISSRCLQAMSW